jgi:DNA-binding MarR family transcriptional regulator
MATDTLDRRVDAVLQFNAYYTSRVRKLEDGLLAHGFTRAELQIFMELAYRRAHNPTWLQRNLGMEISNVSRILKSFRAADLVCDEPAPYDGRLRLLSLTAHGSRVFRTLDEQLRRETRELLQSLFEPDQKGVVNSMRYVEAVLKYRRRQPRD